MAWGIAWAHGECAAAGGGGHRSVSGRGATGRLPDAVEGRPRDLPSDLGPVTILGRQCRRSSVVEQLFCKQLAVSSNLTVGSHFDLKVRSRGVAKDR